MKKTLFLFFILLSIISNVEAQRYSINKLKYDYRQYVPDAYDPYTPAISGVCSFLIPGLGQMISGEVGRGVAFLGGYTCCSIVAGVGLAQIYSNSFDYYNTGNTGSSNAGVGTLLVGLGGMAVVSIWSIVDAVNVAKVNNMYAQSLRKTSSIKLEMSPYLGQLSINNQNVSSMGMTMRIRF